MAERNLDRRDFNKLTTAALGGLAAGSLLGCNQGAKPPAADGDKAPGGETTIAKADIHLCRGLNECKGQGKDGKNDCRGQGVCATAKEHTCGGQNECKGLGGCGEEAGANDCKGKGGCHVPLMTDPPGESVWDKLRKKKEAEWSEKKLQAGAAPAKAA
jgi:hypothetical protein